MSAFGTIVGHSYLSAILLSLATLIALPPAPGWINKVLGKSQLKHLFGDKAALVASIALYAVGISVFDDVQTAAVDVAQVQPAQADEFLEIDIEGFRTIFNQSIDSIGLNTGYYIDSINVMSGPVNDTFLYSFKGVPVSMTGAMEKNGTQLKNVIVIYKPDDSDSVYGALAVMGNLVITLSPELSKEDRGN